MENHRHFKKIYLSLPPKLKVLTTDLIACLVYFPIARICKILEKLKINTNKVPLSFYKDKSFYTMRTDARDRFGTILEKRFSQSEIKQMMERANLVDVKFSKNEPFWCAVGIKK